MTMWTEHKQKVTVYLFIEPQELILGGGGGGTLQMEMEEKDGKTGDTASSGIGGGEKVRASAYGYTGILCHTWLEWLFENMVWVRVCALLSTLFSLALVKQTHKWWACQVEYILRNDHSCVSYAVIWQVLFLLNPVLFFLLVPVVQSFVCSFSSFSRLTLALAYCQHFQLAQFYSSSLFFYSLIISWHPHHKWTYVNVARVAYSAIEMIWIELACLLYLCHLCAI